jgi:quercetin dioxygenase-like cupin family protein
MSTSLARQFRGLPVLILSLIVLLAAGCDRQSEDIIVENETPPAATVAIHDHAEHDDHILYLPGEITWRDAPPSLERGAEVAILEGNPGEAGIFTMRIKMPDGFHISPHHHPQYERVTVISGTFLLGEGERIDRDATTAMQAGSYTSMPPGMRHFAIAQGETVIQLTSEGPWEITYVNENDDPRLRN